MRSARNYISDEFLTDISDSCLQSGTCFLCGQCTKQIRRLTIKQFFCKNSLLPNSASSPSRELKALLDGPACEVFLPPSSITITSNSVMFSACCYSGHNVLQQLFPVTGEDNYAEPYLHQFNILYDVISPLINMEPIRQLSVREQ